MFISRQELKDLLLVSREQNERILELERAQRMSTIDRPGLKTGHGLLGLYPIAKEFTPREVIEMILKHLKLNIQVTPGQPETEEFGKIVKFEKENEKGKK